MEAAVSSPPGLPAGTRFGDFVAVRPLAAGGMAELYLAARPTTAGLPELVAVKRLLPHLTWDPEFVRMFLDEVRIAAALTHPNIVRVVDFGVGEGGHYLAMEYLHGRTMRAVQRSIREAGPLPLAFAVGTVIEVAVGLHAAHEHRDADGNAVEVVHRDVSPSNVMITFDGQVKLLDFGIARVTQQTQLTRAGTLKGKVGYMSPEQCRGDAVDRRSDVFGLGILLYELTVGRRAFYADNDYAVIGKVVDGAYLRPGRVVEGYPAALEAIVARALEVEPERRYPSAAALVGDLQRFAAGARLDVEAPARAALLERRFGVEPPPTVDLAALVPVERRATPTTASPVRWVALVGAGVLIGGLGFVVGGGLAREDEPADVPAAREAPASVAAPGTEPDARGPGEDGSGAEPLAAEGAAPAGVGESEELAIGPEAGGHGLGLEEGEREGEPGADDEPGAEAPGAARRGRSRRRSSKPKTTGLGDPDALLPPSWREQ